MRARSIKPGICDNEVLGTADPFYTLLFERLWMMADREGRLEDRPLRIKAQAFPYRDGLDVGPMLDWLDQQGFIRRYEVGSARCIQILKFLDHQKPHQNEKASVIPPLDQAGTTKVTSGHNQGNKHLALTPSSLTPDSPFSESPFIDSPTCADGANEVELKPGPNPKPAGVMAIALRNLGVVVTSMDPTLEAWIRDGFTVQQATEAVDIARIRKRHPEAIPANYLDKILRQPPRPPPKLVDRVTWRPPADDEDQASAS